MTSAYRVQLFAVGSFGGHFEQVLEMRKAWAGLRCLYVTTQDGPLDALEGERLAVVSDCHSGQPIRAALCLVQTALLFARHRPACVFTTGALPGLIAALVGRLAGVPVIWIDSVANAETMSGSGRLARRLARKWCTQWPGVASREGSQYLGSLF